MDFYCLQSFSRSRHECGHAVECCAGVLCKSLGKALSLMMHHRLLRKTGPQNTTSSFLRCCFKELTSKPKDVHCMIDSCCITQESSLTTSFTTVVHRWLASHATLFVRTSTIILGGLAAGMQDRPFPSRSQGGSGPGSTSWS